MAGRAINTHDGKAPDHKGIQIDDRFITTIQGKEFVLYAGLLDLAHQKGLRKLVVEFIQLPNQENSNTAICKAVAETIDGEVFADIGDANPVNTNKKVVNHIIRMASTRAKARCLRDLTNVGLCAVEELGDLNGDDITGIDVPNPKQAAANGYHDQKANGNGTDQNTPKASAAQMKAIQDIAKRHKMKDDILSKIVLDQYGVTLTDISTIQAADLIRFLQKAA
ncbi:MAG TPA: hypothetical protein PK250_07595 [Syntrophobacter fumaroxidans]|nr:hypothetical protein [Syntrophobacter fumaroxidans]